MIAILSAAAVSAMLSGAGTAYLCRRAEAWGLIDVPNERSLHSRVMPRGGGIALAAVVALGLLALATLGMTGAAGAAVLVGAALIVAAIGWQDDRRSVDPGPRMLVHLLAALALIAAWGTFDRIALPGDLTWTPSPVMATAITVLWIVALCNVYNFMDGIDGLAAGQAVLAGMLWAWAVAGEVPLVSLGGAIVGGASLGFLWHNWSPARIFMGDVSSGFLGFLFAALPVAAFGASGDPRIPLAGLLLVAPFVFDTSLTLVLRSLRGENVMRAHRNHLYQRLVLAGWSHRRVATLYLVLALLCGLAGVQWLRIGRATVMAVALVGLALLPVVVLMAERGRKRSHEAP
jgi:UDP-N-acetylmuramyl pentapeptide phosphotransferase/UDP-N-acetylglucosamine-1-phosphate transferase